MENRSSSSDADALPSGGLAGAAAAAAADHDEREIRPAIGEEESAATTTTAEQKVGEQQPPPSSPPPPQKEGEGITAEEVKDMMDLDAPLSEREAVSATPPPAVPEISNDTPEAAAPVPPRTMTTPPPPPVSALSLTTTPPQPPPQTARDLRQILQAAGSIRTQFTPHNGSVPPSPIVQPGALHEFEVSSPTSPSTRRRSSATAGIAGLEELRNRIDAAAGPLDQLIQAADDLHMPGFGDFAPRAHVIDAFVRLDFDDGHVFYVRNSSVVFGRAEGASSNSFSQLGPDGSTVIGSEPFGGFDPTTASGAMSMKREKKKRRKKKDGGVKTKSSTSAGSSAAGFTYMDSFARNPYPFGQQQQQQQQSGRDEVPIIHLPLASGEGEVAAAPPKKNISRRHAVLNYNFAKRRFELKITGKNGAFVEDEFVHCDTTWVVGTNGMRVQIGGVGFKVVVPVVPGGGFEVDTPVRGKGGKGKMSTSFTDEYGNEVKTDFSEDEEMEVGEGSRDSDGSMEGESEEQASGDEEEEDEEEGEDDEEAQEGDVENSEGESESEESSGSDEEEAPLPMPEPVKVEKKRGRGRPRKDEAETARQELEKAKAKEKAKEKERRLREKQEAARRAKEVEREKERERKRLEELRQKEERAKQKERARREKEQQREQKKLHLPEPRKASKLYLPTPAAKKKEADKSLTSPVRKGPGRPPKAKPSPPPSQAMPQQVHEQLPMPAMDAVDTSMSPLIPEPEQAFSPSNPLMAVAVFNANTPAIDPALYNSTPYAPMPMQHIPPPTPPKPAREPKPKKEKPPVKKRTPSPEINEADYPPEALLKPAASYVILIHEAISNSEEKALTLPQIYKAIERKYPYFKLRVTTTGWQSSVRHNLGAHKAFVKVTRSGKGWMWGINEGVSIEKEKNKANMAASRPPVYQPHQQPLGYQNGNGGYHQQNVNGYPQPQNMGVPMYTDNQMGVPNGMQRPVYQPVAMPQYQPQPQPQTSRMPPMPMAYQPPTAQQSAASPTVNGQLSKQPSQQFPNAPIPPPAGKLPAQQQKPNGFPPETLAAIQGLQKQLALLTNQGASSSSSSSAPSGVNPALVSQAQQLLTGLMSGKVGSRGLTGGADLVKQLTKVLIQQGAVRNGAAAAGVPGRSTPAAVSSPALSVPVASVTVSKPTVTVVPAAASSQSTSTVAPPVVASVPVLVAATGASQAGSVSQGATPAKMKVPYSELTAEQKKKLYIALMAAKEKKERELREAAAGVAGGAGSPSGVKRPLDDGGAGPVAKKIDVGSGSGGAI